MKRCTKCGDEKPLGEFNRDRSRADGLHPWCKTCRSKANSAWTARTIDARHAYQAEWRKANKERRAAYEKAWRAESWADYYLANGDALRAKSRARYDPAKARAYRKPETWRRTNARRRARLLEAYVEDVPFEFIVQRDQGICGICNEAVMDDAAELDHVIPLAAGGLHERDNVQLAHRSCNRQKSSKVGFTLTA